MDSFAGICVVALFTSLVICSVLIYLSKSKHWFVDDRDKPQRFHSKDTPRSGGIGIIVGFLLGSLLLSDHTGVMLFLASLPVVATGLFEDALGRIAPSVRLISAFISAALGVFLTGFLVEDLGFFPFLHLPYIISLAFTIFAVAGVTNSINIIDGFNGLASGFSLIALTVFAFTFYSLFDTTMFEVSVVMIFATLGFFVLNFPRGRIFLGDGGAYFLGFMLAELSVALVWRHHYISPWFCLAVMIYPVWEVMFSFYRRKFLQGMPVMNADRMHLHSIIYEKITHSNPGTSALMLLFILPFDILAWFYKARTSVATLIILVFIVIYTMSYHAVIWRKG